MRAVVLFIIKLIVMFKVHVIGNLGADAQVKEANGSKFISFRVAHTESFTDGQGNKRENTVWIDCTMSNAESKVLPYLKKGTKVFVYGNASLRTYSSAKMRMLVAGCSCAVQSVELIGGSSDDVPRQLFDAGGALHQVAKAFYSDVKDTQLFSQQGDQFDVSAEGWITKRKEDEQETTA